MKPVTLEFVTAYQALLPHQKTKLPLLLRVKTAEGAQQQRSPASIAMCVDTSGSMHGEPINLVLQSISLVVDHLRSDDRAALVSFASEGHIWLESQPFDEQAKTQITKALRTIKADGNTAMYDGLEKSLMLLAPQKDNMPRRILLLTDGQPNVGPSSSEALARLVREKRGDVVVSTFGFGAHHDEVPLQAIARAGGGGYTYIEDAKSAPAAFALELGALFSTVARKTKLYINPHQGCTVLGIRGDNEQRFSSKGLEVSLSDLIAGRTLELMADLELETLGSESSRPWASLRIEYWLPEAKEATVHEVELSLAVQEDASQEVHPDIARQLLLLDAGQAWKEAQEIAGRGDFTAAAEHLTPIIERLGRSPVWEDETSDVRDWYEQLVDEKDIYTQRPDMGRYQEFRKQALAEMQMPGEVAYTGSTMIARGNMIQQQIASSFRTDGGVKARLEIYDKDRNLLQTQEIQGETTLGRMAGNDIHLPSSALSKRHAKISPIPGGFMVVDLASTNGVFVNGQSVLKTYILKDGDEIALGDFLVIFRNAN